MKTLIAIPCMDTLPAAFLRSLLQMQIIGEVGYDIVTSSLIYDARNQIIQHAVQGGYEYILWLDSDMVIPQNTMYKLKIGIEAGFDLVSGLYFKRIPPYSPVIYRRCELVRTDDGKLDPTAEEFEDYPRNSLFEIEGCGFGCCLMTTDLAGSVMEKLGKMPFMPVGGFGEDLSFCLRARQVGGRIGCDSSVQAGHCGRTVFDEEWYLNWKERAQEEAAHGDGTA